MANLSAYIDFSVVLDKSVSTPVIRLTDPNNYPPGVSIYVTGVFTITQPDGITVNGNISSPDIYWTGASLKVAEKELRLDDTENFQNGTYTITYTVSCIGYDDTVLSKSFDITYAALDMEIDDVNDIFTPSIQAIDITSYSKSGFNTPTITRAWTANIQYIGTSVQTVTGTSVLFDMAYIGQYYDAKYLIALISTVIYTTPTYSYLSLKDKVIGTSVIDAYTPQTLTELRSLLATLKTQIANGTYCGYSCNCGCGSDSYEEALTLYNTLVMEGQSGNTSELYLTLNQMLYIFYCSLVQSHTGQLLTSYSFGSNTQVKKPIQFTVGSGQQYAPIAGATDYNNPTLAGNNNYVIYRQAIGDYLFEGVDFNYKTTGGFTLLTFSFIEDERFTLIFNT